MNFNQLICSSVSPRHGPPMATRSLSATSRKPQPPAGAEPRLHGEVLEAIRCENERVGEGAGGGNHREGEPGRRKPSLEVAQPSDTRLAPLRTVTRSSSDKMEPTDGLYSASPNSVAAAVSNNCVQSTPLESSASGSDELLQRRPALVPRDGQPRPPTASESLTEETLRVITERVRKMDAR